MTIFVIRKRRKTAGRDSIKMSEISSVDLLNCVM